MQIKINKQILLNTVQKAQNIIAPKSTLPILSNIFIEAFSNKIRMNATDLDLSISCELPVETLEEGSITIPAKRFSDIIREFPDGIVNIHVKKNHQIDIECGHCRFKLLGLPVDEFPKFPQFNKDQFIEIEQKVCKEMLKRTSFAVSFDESRYVFNGVLLEVRDQMIRMVATDGRRLAKIEKIIKNVNHTDFQMVIPIKTVNELMRNLSDTGSLKLFIGMNQVLFDIDGVLIASRIIEGDYPNYEQVIPKPGTNKISLKTKDFLSSIKRANLLTTPDFQAVKFELFSNKLVISKSTPDVGESREEIDIDYSGIEMVVGFNPQYLIDFLKNLEEDQLQIELLGGDKPAVIRMKDYLYLALPMKI